MSRCMYMRLHNFLKIVGIGMLNHVNHLSTHFAQDVFRNFKFLSNLVLYDCFAESFYSPQLLPYHNFFYGK